MSWVYDRQISIYSRVNALLLSKLTKKHRDLNFNITMDNAQSTSAKFPTVYITFIGADERGQTLDGKNINAVNMTVEVHVLTTKSQGASLNSEIAWEATEAFKSMGFTATMPNIPLGNSESVYESVSRYSRIIGQDDVLYTV